MSTSEPRKSAMTSRASMDRGYVTAYSSGSDDSSDEESWDLTPKKGKKEEIDAAVSDKLKSLSLQDFHALAKSNTLVAKSNKEVAASNKQVAFALTEQARREGTETGGSDPKRVLEQENKKLSHENGRLKDDLIRSLRNNAGLGARPGKSIGQDCADDEKIANVVTGALLQKDPGVLLDDVAGLEQAKDIVEETFLLPIAHPELFEGRGLEAYKSLLLYGPPGTGKTLLAKAIATETESVFVNISPSVVMSKWYGESESIVKAIFEMARESEEKRFVVFFDEMDSLGASRGGGSDAIPRNIVSELLIQLDGMAQNGDNLVVVGATNRPQSLDSAILQRFEVRVCIPLPNMDARIEIIRLLLSDVDHRLEGGDFEELGDLTDGASGREIKALVKRALLEPIKRCKKADRFHPLDDGRCFMACLDSANCPHCQCCKPCRKPKKGDSCKSCGTKRWRMSDFEPGELKVESLGFEHFEAAFENWNTVADKEGDLDDEYAEWTKKYGQLGV
ncbi:hypothetical protein ACHAXT_007826 [Thalassiosira profunda]